MDELIENYCKYKKAYYDACDLLEKEMESKGIRRIELPDMILTLASRRGYISVYDKKIKLDKSAK